jgi:acetyl/propionyl-CoA carboxylase alpha subunit/acetyl-CoA carboxylase carboxyltransferase component
MIKKLLIANRGEISIRVARAAAELGIATVAIYSEDDAGSLHVCKSDEAVALVGVGATAYLNIEKILEVALEAGCDAVHPGYGFLSENVSFAKRCEEAGLVFVGPTNESLQLFGDKSRACAFAQQNDIPIIPGTRGPTTLEETRAFFESGEGGQAVMIKAIAGGGGRGMRAVTSLAELDAAYAQCRAEAISAFGSGDLYVERLIERARHIEIQILGDGTGNCVHFGERECTLQRRNQKLVEIAPSPTLKSELRERLTGAALKLARLSRFRGLGTFEFLVDSVEPADDRPGYAFIETNPRLQVEHTITEMVTGIDLVKHQLEIAGGKTLDMLGLETQDAVRTTGYAVELRINMETMTADGIARPAGGTLSAFNVPSGPGIRVDTYGYAGFRTSSGFDSLLAKLIVFNPDKDFAALLRKADRALGEFQIGGVSTNKTFLHGLLNDDRVIANDVDTTFVGTHFSALMERGRRYERHLYVVMGGSEEHSGLATITPPLEVPENMELVTASMQGLIVSIQVEEGARIDVGSTLAVIEAMKMQTDITAPVSGFISRIIACDGVTVFQGDALFVIAPDGDDRKSQAAVSSIDLDVVPPALTEILERKAAGSDERRPDAVARRRKRGQRTVRENVDDLFDTGSVIEYGALAVASQRSRRSIEDLIRNTPADGIITSIGTVNRALFGAEQSRCLALAYDYTVLAGTQGRVGHDKTERMLHLAERWRIPVVLFAEGGGGRSGDVDSQTVAKLQMTTFARFAGLSGLVPRVGIAAGYVFAGNAGLLGCCDVIVATRNASIGMAGPSMIEGGGLGTFQPDEVGPVSVQAPNGVIDVLVDDEAEAVRVTKQYLAYFQGPVSEWNATDQRALRYAIPTERTKAYDMRGLIQTLADKDSVLELRKTFGKSMITALLRIEGKPIGLIANDPRNLGGAIDADAADKAARFMQLCDAFDLPLISLCDTPGFMVGPEAEKTALVRHVSRMFLVSASMSIPVFTIVTRKAYGLGAQAMSAGGFHQPVFTVAWPNGETGAMGLEGFVKLGFKQELESIQDPEERQARFEILLAAEVEKSKAVHSASYAVLDDVIDPAETRRWICAGMRSMPGALPRNGKKRTFVDAW